MEDDPLFILTSDFFFFFFFAIELYEFHIYSRCIPLSNN